MLRHNCIQLLNRFSSSFNDPAL